jgi:hypothetical protein
VERVDLRVFVADDNLVLHTVPASALHMPLGRALEDTAPNL